MWLFTDLSLPCALAPARKGAGRLDGRRCGGRWMAGSGVTGGGFEDINTTVKVAVQNRQAGLPACLLACFLAWKQHHLGDYPRKRDAAAPREGCSFLGCLIFAFSDRNNNVACG
jgi:hypothetical protein